VATDIAALIGKTCYQLGSNIFCPYLWLQISRVVLVYDVKIGQLGRKNLAVRFDMYQIGGGIQFIKCTQERWGIETSRCPPLGVKSQA
jgi:hypothetical protein